MKYSDHLRYIEREGEKEMNRGHVLQSLLPVQQMNMAGNPNWWNINNNIKAPNQEHQPSTFLPSSTSSLVLPHYLPSSPSLPLNTTWNDNQDLPESWSQLLLGGIVGEEDRSGVNQFQAKKMQNWEEHQVMYTPSSTIPASVDVKNEISESDYVYCHGSEEFQATRPNWSNIMAVSSPKSCVTTFGGNNMLDFSNNKGDGRHPQPEHSSESYNTSTGGAIKKARIQSTPAPTTFKVRKEKLGDRITALHQLVSPFGKTDTASVLLEAIGYIRFLHNQIEALSTPYLGNASGNMRQQQLQSVQGEKSCRFPEGPGQLLTKNCMKRKGAPDQVLEIEPKKDLKSRGLCLVPVSCTLHVGSNNGADYWAP